MLTVWVAGLNRIAVKDFTFSDGTFIPKGTMVAAATLPMHLDSDFYEDGESFKPWRFYDAREREGNSVKHAFVGTGIDFHSFGFGRHAWWVYLLFVLPGIQGLTRQFN